MKRQRIKIVGEIVKTSINLPVDLRDQFALTAKARGFFVSGAFITAMKNWIGDEIQPDSLKSAANSPPIEINSVSDRVNVIPVPKVEPEIQKWLDKVLDILEHGDSFYAESLRQTIFSLSLAGRAALTREAADAAGREFAEIAENALRIARQRVAHAGGLRRKSTKGGKQDPPTTGRRSESA